MVLAFSPAYTIRNYNWTDWKAIYAYKGSLFQYDDDDIMYNVWTYDGPEIHTCQIWKGAIPYTSIITQEQNDTNKADFETNYKSLGNQPLSQSDTDGALITRNKAAKKGWTYSAIPIEFGTSVLQSDSSVYFKLLDGTDRAGITCKIYNNSDVEITTAGIDNINLAGAVKTVIDFEPAYDYEVVGGTISTLADITNNVRMWIIGIPDIPAAYGGSKEMCGGINLNYLIPSNTFAVDGRVSKYLKYDATYHTNKLRFVLKYPAGTSANLQIILDLYRA